MIFRRRRFLHSVRKSGRLDDLNGPLLRLLRASGGLLLVEADLDYGGEFHLVLVRLDVVPVRLGRHVFFVFSIHVFFI